MNSNSFSAAICEDNKDKQQLSLFAAYSSAPVKVEPTVNRDDSLQWLTNQSYAVKLSETQSKESQSKSRKRSGDSKRSHKRHEDLNKSATKNDQSKSVKHLSSKVIFLEDTGLPPQFAFRIDRKRDPNNLAFSSLYNLYVANYDKSKTLKSSKLKEKFRKSSQSKSIRFYEDKSLKNDSDVLLCKAGSVSSKIGDFIPLNSLAMSEEFRKAYTIYDYSTSQYIQGKGLEQKPEENKADINFSSLNDGSKTSKGPQYVSEKQIVYNKTQELNKYLKDNPSDIDKWLELLAFQDEFFRAHESDTKSIEKESEVQILEKKLSIVEKALESNPKNTVLNVTRLEILKKFWEPEKVMEEWKKLAFIYPNVPYVWERYINFLQTNISYFTFQAVVKVFIKCISTYTKMLEGFFQSHRPPDNLEDEILKTTLIFCEFLEQCGYTERAFATWQALIEFNLYTPIALGDKPLSECLMHFEAFWDSGLPRFGENNARGWANIMNTQRLELRSSPLDLNEFEDSIISKNMSRSDTWLGFEELRESHHWLPFTEIDEDSDEDVDRSVFFDDIENVLFRLKTTDAKFKLIESFFTFLMKTDKFSLLPIPFIYNMSEVIPSFENIAKLPAEVEKEGLYNFILNCFNQLLEIFEENISLRQMFVTFQLNNCKKYASFELVKSCLQKIVDDDRFTSNLFFWKCLAELAKLSDNKMEMRRIYEKTISSFVGRTDKCQFFSFIVSYVKSMLGMNSLESMDERSSEVVENSVIIKTAVTGILGKSIEQMSAVQLLKVKRQLEVSQKSDCERTTLYCVILQALINYLHCNLEEATLTFENFLSNSRQSVIEEEVYLNYVQLYYFHATRYFQSFSVLRSIVQRALTLYPTNPKLLYVFITIESKSALSVNIRSFFSKILNQARNTLQFWLFAIFAEWRRLQAIYDGTIANETNTLSIGVVWKIRSLFEKALSTENIENSLLIWRLFLKFEVCFGGNERALAVYYRAVQRCPWSKVLYKDGIRYFGNTLQDILDVMNEKEIKVRTPVEEVDLLLDNHIRNECDTSQQDASQQP